MKTTRRLFVLCAAVLVSWIPSMAQAPSLVEPKVERHEGPPLWISAVAVADEQKIVNLDLIDSPFLQKEVERQRRELGDQVLAEKSRAGEEPSVMNIPESQCKSSVYSSGQSHRGGVGPTSTLSDLATNSQSILRGTIRTVDLGFDRGTPATLLGVEASAVIKGSASESLFYVLYPVARFKIGPLYFCNARKGFEPHPGDQILLFNYTGKVGRDNVFFNPRVDQVLFQSQAGALFLPAQLRSSPGMDTIRTLDDVVRRLGGTAISSSDSRGGAQ